MHHRLRHIEVDDDAAAEPLRDDRDDRRELGLGRQRAEGAIDERAGGLLVTVVGRPEGVTSTESAAGASPSQLAKPRETPADREPAQR